MSNSVAPIGAALSGANGRRYDARVTRFAACFLLIFGQLAFGGLAALAVPPFAKVARGFYKSSASVYLAAALVSMLGFALLATRSERADTIAPEVLWAAAALWGVFSSLLALYLYSLWGDNARLRARSFAAAFVLGAVATAGNWVLLMPAGLGLAGAVLFSIAALGGAAALGLSSGAMLFGHWYLIDPTMPVDYLRSYIRLLGYVLGAYVGALVAIPGLLGVGGGAVGYEAASTLVADHAALGAVRLGLGPVAALVLTWMCWQTLKIPQTMAATGLLYITVLAVLVGEMLGRYALFRTGVPL